MNGEQKSTWPELAAILAVRLIVLTGFLALVTLILPSDDIAFYTFMAFAFIITIPYSLWLRNKIKATRRAPLQFLVDLILVTGLVYFTGGIGSDLTLLYPLVILSAGIVATPKQAIQITVLSIVVYLLMAGLLSQDLLAAPASEAGASALHSMYSSVILRIFTFCFFGMASVYVSRRCGYINRQEQMFRNMTEFIFQNVQAGLLLLDTEDRILIANHTACELLFQREEDLAALPFPSLIDAKTINTADSIGHAVYFKRPGGNPFPVTYHRSTVNLPASIVPRVNEKKGDVPVTILVFNDISHIIEMQVELKNAERVSAATKIAGEMAHEIRTPLTAISASIQLLAQYEKYSDATDWLPDSPKVTERAELFEHILSAVDRMDTVIQNFCDFSEYSPEDLMTIIKLDSAAEEDGYIRQFKNVERGIKNGQNSHSR
ncbi:MAG: hypothetical protein K9M45_03600 [Kiritimatiellales bacterium]|nr:hypothetical protein [Kiritimatiellales bacterium]